MTQRLSPGDWAVLGLLDEGASHGFALSRALAPSGELGRVWTVRQALVYRTLDILVQRGLARIVGEQPGTKGPQRTLVEVTPAGRRALRAWLLEPVEHVREARSSLLLKLELLRRAGRDARPLLFAQRERLEQMASALEARIPAAPDHDVLVWRSEAAQAGIRAIDRILAADADASAMRPIAAATAPAS